MPEDPPQGISVDAIESLLQINEVGIQRGVPFLSLGFASG